MAGISNHLCCCGGRSTYGLSDCKEGAIYTRNDIIDVFASFFLLAYNKLMYQIVLFARCLSLQYRNNATSAYCHKFVMMFDMDIDCLSGRHLSLLVPMVVFSIVFYILPSLLLVFYPFKLFRRCLSKCRLDSLLVSTFVEKFHGCYRDGLDGGRDMRSFSGLYFFVVCLTSIAFKILKLPPFVFASSVLLALALLVAFLKPYKQTYMNFCDTLLLAHLTVSSILFSSEYVLYNGTKVFAFLLIPAALFKSIVFFKIFKMLKKKLVKWCKDCSKQEQFTVNDCLEDSEVDTEERQPLVYPSSTVVDMA